MADNNEQPTKVQTRFPGLHAASGVKAADMEVLTPVVVDGTGEGQSSGGEQNNSGAAAQAAGPAAKVGGAGAPEKKDGEQQAPPAEKSKLDLDGLSDEDRNDLLSRLTGGKLKSLDELAPPPAVKTREELDAEEATRKQDALTWALESGRVNRQDYEQAIVDNAKGDRELALTAFLASDQAEGLSPAEAEELFKDVFHEGQKEDTPLFKAGQREIKKLADAYRKDKLSMLGEIGPAYEEHAQTQNQYKSFKKQVKAIAEAQPKTLDFSIPFANLDGSSTDLKYSVPVDPKVLNQVLADLSSENSFAIMDVSSKGKIDEKALAKEMAYHVKARMFDVVIPQLLADHAVKVEQEVIVKLGNKRTGAGSLNNGQQGTPGAPGGKVNTYPGLSEWSNKQKN